MNIGTDSCTYAPLIMEEVTDEEGLSSNAIGTEIYTIQYSDYIHEFPSTSFKLLKPIPIQITEEKGYYYLKQLDFNICESGETLDEAMFELTEFIMDDYLNWLRTPDEQLSTEAKIVIQKYTEFFKYLG